MSGGKVRIGISGWRYPPWRGVFYPDDLVQRRELEYAACAFDTIEINGTFYSLQRPKSFEDWAAETPDDFVFAVKGSRYITHMLRLKDTETALANFFAQGLFALGRKLGPILWQFPARFKYDPDRIEGFLAALPRDTEIAAKLARKHDRRTTGRAVLKPGRKRKLRHALEIRSDSFVCGEFIAQLRRHRAGLVIADTVDWPCIFDVTADFVYVRLHGSKELYVSGYDHASLDEWADRIDLWARGEEPEGDYASEKAAPAHKTRDVYVYFDNDAKVRAPFDAQGLMARIEERGL